MIAHESSGKVIRSSKMSQGNVSDDEASEVSESERTDSDVKSDDTNGAGDSDGSGDDRTKDKANPGWADVMQKILKSNKPKRKKSIVLSKAKKLTEVRSKEAVEKASFEIQTEDGEFTRESLPKRVQQDKKDNKDEDTKPVKRRRKELQSAIRVKPSFHDRERERLLQKIATKGVVQLFNVVKQQQTEINEKISAVGPLERKRERVLSSIDKRAFLDVLMGGSKSIPVNEANQRVDIDKNEDDKPDKVWSVLRDDFTMGAKLKDWDKKAPEDDNESTSSEEMDSD